MNSREDSPRIEPKTSREDSPSTEPKTSSENSPKTSKKPKNVYHLSAGSASSSSEKLDLGKVVKALQKDEKEGEGGGEGEERPWTHEAAMEGKISWGDNPLLTSFLLNDDGKRMHFEHGSLFSKDFSPPRKPASKQKG